MINHRRRVTASTRGGLAAPELLARRSTVGIETRIGTNANMETSEYRTSKHPDNGTTVSVASPDRHHPQHRQPGPLCSPNEYSCVGRTHMPVMYHLQAHVTSCPLSSITGLDEHVTSATCMKGRYKQGRQAQSAMLRDIAWHGRDQPGRTTYHPSTYQDTLAN